MFDAGFDEQLIMTRTGHSSTGGVRSYKRVTEKQEKTLNVLNAESLMTTPETTKEMKPTRPQASHEVDTLQKENTDPVKSELSGISFAGATNFTVNFNF